MNHRRTDWETRFYEILLMIAVWQVLLLQVLYLAVVKDETALYWGFFKLSGLAFFLYLVAEGVSFFRDKRKASQEADLGVLI